MTAPVDPFVPTPGYQSRLTPHYFDDTAGRVTGLIWQPDVYLLLAHLAAGFDCTRVLDLGCGTAEKLVALPPQFQTVGVDYQRNLAHCRERYPQRQWLEWDLERPDLPPLAATDLSRTAMVCADVIEHLVNPGPLLHNLRALLEQAPLALLSTPDRDRTHGPGHLGPPPNPAHVREWNLPELTTLLERVGLHIAFAGWTVNNQRDLARSTSLVVLHNNSWPRPGPASPEFRVVAFMTAYNEADIIAPALDYLIQQGVEVYLLDNWSTDDTVARARPFLGRGLIAIEQFPKTGPSATYDWKLLLQRVEELAQSLPADWFLHHDVDEEREAPWPGLTLRDALYHVQQLGFNCIDHTVLEVSPVNNDYCPGTPLHAHFRHCEFARGPGALLQKKAWRNTGQAIQLAASGGHEVEFSGRRVCPYRFLLRHYPIRSQAHGERKVHRERQARWNAEERAQAWHAQYDGIRPGHQFLRLREELLHLDPQEFYAAYLVERLTGWGAWLRGQPTAPPRVAAADEAAFLREEVLRALWPHCSMARQVLELGCGAGELGRQLCAAWPRLRYAGIEGDPQLAQQAQQILERVDCTHLATLQPGELGLEPGSIDLLLAVDVLQQLPSPVAVLARLVPLLRPHGRVVFTVPNLQRAEILLSLVTTKDPAQSVPSSTELRGFLLSSVRQLCQLAGLVIEQILSVLDPHVNLTEVRPQGNTFHQGPLQLADLSREDVLRLFTRRFIVLARRRS